MNVFERDTFRIEIISNCDDVTLSYQDSVLDRLNTDAKLYRTSFIDQGKKKKKALLIPFF